PGDKRLTAYITTTPGAPTPTTHKLRTHLQHQLPDYMIPATNVTLDQLPHTPNGKVDTKAHPPPRKKPPPQTPTQKKPPKKKQKTQK
ncbi:AMP-binding enzyme, partial [Streptomyces sp. BE133]|uniref:AMP-binding enzyme n=1 Tax=Streptomyces sp. BE133 TaxID=3002523 RepID=UPI002E75F5E4